MSGRTKRGHLKKDQILEKLAVGRSGSIQTQTEAKINSPDYRAAMDLTDSIDRLAEVLTGEPGHFHVEMTPASKEPKGRN
ncbi:MAG: hypothetical protein AAGA97_01190 [Pseudomonadota bacterium]